VVAARTSASTIIAQRNRRPMNFIGTRRDQQPGRARSLRRALSGKLSSSLRRCADSVGAFSLMIVC